MNNKLSLILIAALLVAVGVGGFFGGRASKSRPQISVSSPKIDRPETKPLVPDTVTEVRFVLKRDTITQTVTDTLWDTVHYVRGLKPAVFAGRSPHTGDTVKVDTARGTVELIPFGLVPQQAPIEAKTGIKRQPLLEVGAIWSWGGTDQLWATVPNLARRADRRVIYIPERIGVAFQPSQHRLGLVVSWDGL